MALSADFFCCGLWLHLSLELYALLLSCGVAPGQIAINGWQVIMELLVLWKLLSFPPITPDEYHHVYHVKRVGKSSSPGWFYGTYSKNKKIITGAPSSTKGWKQTYSLVGGNWEFDPAHPPPLKRLKTNWSSGCLLRSFL